MNPINIQNKTGRLRVLVEFMLVKSTPICALSAALGVIITQVIEPFSIITSALIFGTLMGGFFGLDSIRDIEPDSKYKPNRPIPSGRLSKKEGWIFVIILFSISSLLSITLYLFQASLQTVLLAFLSLTLAIIYSLPPTLSRIPLLSNIVLASLFTLLPLLTGWTIFRPLEQAPFFIITALFFLALGDIEDFVDIDADKFAGTKTLPISLGIRRAGAFFSLISFISVVIGAYDFLTSFKIYWLFSLPQQLTLVLLTMQLTRKEKPDVLRLHKIGQVLSISIALTLLLGYIIYK